MSQGRFSPLPAPGNLCIELSKLSGQLELTWDRVPGRMFYEGQWNQADPGVEDDWKALVNLSCREFATRGYSNCTAA